MRSISQIKQHNTQFKRYMYVKAFLLCALVACASAYTQQGNVLVLKDEDFPAVLSEFSHILVEFYAPWCGHCKKLAPVYTEVADALKEQGSVVRLAKVDATENEKSAGEYGVRGYPTIFFFLNGEKMDYSGQRSKQSMINWLLKKTRDPVSEIDAEKYATLASSGAVSVVYHGGFANAEGAEILNKIAAADDYNTYYWGKDLGKDEGTVELIRYFADPMTYGAIDDGLKNWVAKNQRPLIVPFDERTIGDVFGSQKLGVVLFNGEDSETLLNSFKQAAEDYSQTDGKPLIFTQITKSNEHLENFANYIKITHTATPVVLIEAGSQTKYVMKDPITKQSLLAFLNSYEDYKYGITDEVKVDLPDVDEL